MSDIKFSDYSDQEEIIRTVGDAELLYKAGKKIMRYKKSTYGKEKEISNYNIIKDLMKGKVLNVGLGMGQSADVILAQKAVKELISQEIEPDIANLYKEEKGDNHKIQVVDAHKGKPKEKFDVILYELFINDQKTHDEAMTYITHAKDNMLKDEGIILLRYDRYANLLAMNMEESFDASIISRPNPKQPLPLFLKLTKKQ